MTAWTARELDKVGAADELEIAPYRRDGSPRGYVTIWVVRVGDDLYVRSYRGEGGAWYGSALRSGLGRIRAGGVEREVSFAEPAGVDRQAIDEAYRSKYARYPTNYVDQIVSADSAGATLRLVPR
jgi:hypothetical protein